MNTDLHQRRFAPPVWAVVRIVRYIRHEHLSEVDFLVPQKWRQESPRSRQIVLVRWTNTRNSFRLALSKRRSFFRLALGACLLLSMSSFRADIAHSTCWHTLRFYKDALRPGKRQLQSSLRLFFQVTTTGKISRDVVQRAIDSARWSNSLGECGEKPIADIPRT